ncbi:DUF748 domain-containing protein [Halopseudomonas aestusnigri]|uniref:Uncharacterized protein involved in outer membrane biogenesis n=1 Tax=Halopseudomonas aestusnigri TaxID=857252 RepID=A0AAQ1G3R0_9GAMM|nr:DUF748 domain-containing protein [Halopseudomonas aestusnigri]OWL90736.1 hypothetical protein B7O88_00045 [Halopseudomonas aestusnigri]SEF42188.1 Uncharacterized protein involved in outer membrane biogenesis [Halopseudomonas aestusnigri]
MRLRKKTLFVSLLTALFAYTLIGALLLPAIILHVANQQLNRFATVPAKLERVEFNPFSFEATLWNLHIGAPDVPQIAFRRAYANLQLDSLWHGALHLSDVELERAYVDARLDAEGRLNLLQLFDLPASEPREPDPNAQPFPVLVDRIALISNSANFQDLRPSEAVEFAYDAISLELHNLSTLPDNQGNLRLTASGPYGATLDWDGRLSLSPLRASGRISLHAAELQTVWPYVHERLPLLLQSGAISASTDYHIDLSERTDVRLNNARLNLDSLIIDNNDKPLLRVPSLSINDGSLDLASRQARLGSIQSQGLEAWAARLENGQIDLLALLPKPPTEDAPSTDQDAAPAASASTEDAETEATRPQQAPQPTWQLQVAQADLSGYQLHLQDRLPDTDVNLELAPLSISISDFDSAASTPFRLQLQTGVNGDGNLSAAGEVNLRPLSASLDIASRDINLQLARAYVEPLVDIQLRSGLMDGDLKLQLRGTSPLDLAITGEASVSQLHVVDSDRKRDLLKWQQLQVTGINYRGESLSIERISLQRPYVRFIVNENLTTNFSDLIVKQPGQPEPGTPASDKPPMALRIGGIDIHDGSANFADFSLTPNFATAMGQLNGQISTIDNQRPLVANVDISGRVDRYAPVTIKGGLTPFDPLNSLDIATRFRNVELTTLTPYSGKFAGYRIRKGRMNLDLEYRIQQGQLNAQNKLLLEGLQLGEKVDSPDAVDLPVRLAVALLKDTNGNIDLSIPVSGDLNNPEFSVMPLVWQTLRNLLLRATQAPFKFIAGLVSGDQADISQISFAAGSAELDGTAQSALDTLAQALQERPALILEVQGRSAIEQDGPPLAAERLETEYQRLQYQILQNSGKKLPADPSELVVEEEDKPILLEAIYRTQLKQQPPTDWAELEPEERTTRLRQAVLTHWRASQLMLRRLAQLRASNIKGYLTERAGMQAERVFQIDVSITGDSGEENVSVPMLLDSN